MTTTRENDPIINISWSAETSPVRCKLDGENAVPFNWESSIYGSHSSGKGINILKKIVEQLIISRVDH